MKLPNLLPDAKASNSAFPPLVAALFCAAVMFGCGGGGSGSSSVTLSGVAATGAPMANAKVSANCAGVTGSTTTKTDGSYSVAVVGGALPCLIEANDGVRKLHSIATGTTVANVTPLTEQLVASLSQDTADTAAFFESFGPSHVGMVSTDKISAAHSKVLADLQLKGLDVSGITDVMKDKLVAKVGSQEGNAYDKLLDAVADTAVTVKLIALNDFHGNIEPTSQTNGGSVILPDGGAGTKVAVGGAAYLASTVKALQAKNAKNIVVGAGDLISASPFASAITHDEAAVDILNQIGVEVSSVGNHEFDRGVTELQRMQNGGCFPASGTQGVVGKDTCLTDGAFAGAKFKYLTANVVNTSSNKPLFAATYVKRFGTVSVGFIGLTLKGTTQLVSSNGVAGYRFDEESATINKYATKLKEDGVTAVVVLIHQGGQTTASTLNDKSCPGFSGDILPILDKINSKVDVVVSGHTHQEYVCNYPAPVAEKNILITSTGFYGSAVSEIDLSLKPSVGVVSAAANTVPVIRKSGTFTASGSDATNTNVPAAFAAAVVDKDAAIDALVTKYVNISKVAGAQTVGTITASINRALLPNSTTRDETTEGALGALMADTYKSGVPGGADIAFVNPGSVRADLTFSGTGAVTFSNLATIEPFGNTLVTLNLTGAQILRLLEQQWEAPNNTAKVNTVTGAVGRLLLVSNGFSYTYDHSKPAGATSGNGARVVVSTMRLNGVPIDMAKTYKIATNSFLGTGLGGDNFTVMARQGTNVIDTKILDLDAFIDYFKTNSPVSPPSPRITRLN